MANGIRAVALVAFLAALGAGLTSPRAADETDCTGSPNEAIMTLPAPLDKWGQVSCTPFGHVLSSRKGWVWLLPTGSRPVIVPSQMVDRMPRVLGNKSYFTGIEVARVKGEEFDRVYEIFHEGFDPKEVMPDGYRVDLTSVSGKTMRLYFFDYDSYAWGIECPAYQCNRETRFAILDQKHVPLAREPSI